MFSAVYKVQVPGSFSDQEWVQAFVLPDCTAPVSFDEAEVGDVLFMPLHEVRCCLNYALIGCLPWHCTPLVCRLGCADAYSVMLRP